jgi:hypothetical protein
LEYSSILTWLFAREDLSHLVTAKASNYKRLYYLVLNGRIVSDTYETTWGKEGVTYVKTLLEESGEIGDSRRANVWPPEYEVGLYDYSTKLGTRERRERILK